MGDGITLEDLSNIIRKERIDDIKTKTAIIKTMVQDDVDLYESEYLKYFHPLVINAIPRTRENITVFIDNVLAVTESPTVGIRVIDEKNSELFLLPPIIIGLDTKNSILDNISFTKIIKNYIYNIDTNVYKATKYVDRGLKIIDRNAMMSNERLKKYLIGLVKLYKRYNLGFKDIEIIDGKLYDKNTKKEIEPNRIPTDDIAFDYD